MLLIKWDSLLIFYSSISTLFCRPRLTRNIFCHTFFASRSGSLKTNFSVAGLAGPVGQTTFHLPTRPCPLVKSSLICRGWYGPRARSGPVQTSILLNLKFSTIFRIGSLANIVKFYDTHTDGHFPKIIRLLSALSKMFKANKNWKLKIFLKKIIFSYIYYEESKSKIQ